MKSLHISTILIALTLMASCGRQHGEATAVLDRADSLMVSQPDSAYALLHGIGDEVRAQWRKADMMRYELTLAKAMNKTSVRFDSDSVMQVVVRYYDRHGSPDERMRAHYLLGCAYRDLGESPLAVKCFYDAIDCADTRSKRCDYTTLSHIYGQMGEIFTAQRLTHMQLEAYQQYSRYAHQAGNSYEYARGIECMVQPYYQLNDTAKVFEVTQRARELYLRHGMKHAAARVYPTAISVALRYGQWERARGMMHIFETESGLFGRDGTIGRGHELYYQSQGLYHLGMHRLDSAEHAFRRLAAYHPLEGYRGLLQVYEQRQVADSIARFARLYEAALDAFVRNRQTEATHQAAALYNYSRIEKIARSKSREALRNRRIIVAGGVIIALAALALVLKGRQRRKARRRLEKAYARTQAELRHAREELTCLQNILPMQEEAAQFLASKERRIAELESATKDYQQQLGILDTVEREELLMASDIVRHLQTICQPHAVEDKNGRKRHLPPRAASHRELDTLRKLFKKHHLSFMLFIDSHPSLTNLEYKVCLLSRVQFMTKEMSTLLDSSDQAVSNARTSIARKLFQLPKASDLNARLRDL